MACSIGLCFKVAQSIEILTMTLKGIFLLEVLCMPHPALYMTEMFHHVSNVQLLSRIKQIIAHAYFRTLFVTIRSCTIYNLYHMHTVP